MKFLIVERNARFRAFLREFIAQGDDIIIELEGSRDVREALVKYEPDYIIIDIKSKDDDLNLAAALKKEFPNVRFILISDYKDEKFKAKAKKIYADGIVSKENLLELQELVYFRHV